MVSIIYFRRNPIFVLKLQRATCEVVKVGHLFAPVELVGIIMHLRGEGKKMGNSKDYCKDNCK